MPSQKEMRSRLAASRGEAQPPELSRWRATRLTPDGKWRVKSEAGALCPEPNTFTEYGPAFIRATDLNKAEQYAILGLKPPS